MLSAFSYYFSFSASQHSQSLGKSNLSIRQRVVGGKNGTIFLIFPLVLTTREWNCDDRGGRKHRRRLRLESRPLPIPWRTESEGSSSLREETRLFCALFSQSTFSLPSEQEQEGHGMMRAPIIITEHYGSDNLAHSSVQVKPRHSILGKKQKPN